MKKFYDATVARMAMSLLPSFFRTISRFRFRFSIRVGEGPDEVMTPDPRRGRHPVPDTDAQGSVAVWQIADGGGQRGGNESRSCRGEGGCWTGQVAGQQQRSGGPRVEAGAQCWRWKWNGSWGRGVNEGCGNIESLIYSIFKENHISNTRFPKLQNSTTPPCPPLPPPWPLPSPHSPSS